MAGQVFAYISHRQGKADDAAFELAKAAGKIYPDTAVTAIITGAGAELEAVCSEMAAFYSEVWKFDNEALAYPNAEAVRKALGNILPPDAVVLAAQVGHLSGAAIIGALKRGKNTRHVRAVLFAASEADKQEALEAGASAHVSTSDLTGLRDTLEALMGVRH